jgi:transcriptional regulator with GAF, ATPase, and Fis domain
MVIESLELKRGLELACRSEAAVLITGETGTGKSTLAERIHRESARSTSSLHEATIEATLFGHERGAFTGADRNRTGRFELAEGGTLFLDEIAELSLPLQARLLEFLQTKSFTPLGSTRERRIDVRVICATNRKLENEVRAGKFREDLYHRIRVLHLDLPALADLEISVNSKMFWKFRFFRRVISNWRSKIFRDGSSRRRELLRPIE